MIPTHAFTMNGRSNWDLQDGVRPVHDEIRHMVRRLNGNERFSLAIWKLPAGVSLAGVDLNEDRSYIQCGGTAERMSVELRTVDDGVVRQEVVGRPVAETPPGDPKEEVPFGGGYGVRVYPNEVFDADEAGDLFISYYESGDVPAGYTKRLLQAA